MEVACGFPSQRRAAERSAEGYVTFAGLSIRASTMRWRTEDRSRGIPEEPKEDVHHFGQWLEADPARSRVSPLVPSPIARIVSSAVQNLIT
jgi:hypothetical protein